MSTDNFEESTRIADLEAKVRQLEIQLEEKEVALGQVQCKLMQTKQQLSSAQQQIATHNDYKVKLEKVLSNMQVQHELIVTKLTETEQSVVSKLLSQNKRKQELQDVFETDPRTHTQPPTVDEDEEVYEGLEQDIPKSVQVATEPEALQSSSQCQGDLESQVNTKLSYILRIEQNTVRLLNYKCRKKFEIFRDCPELNKQLR